MAKFYVKLALLVLFAGFVLLIVGQATPYWLVRPGLNKGLWRSCLTVLGKTACTNLDSGKGFDTKVWAPRILNIVACVASFISLGLLVSYLHRNDGQANRRRITMAVILCLAAAVCVLIGIAVYVSGKHGAVLSSYDYGWSFYLTVVAMGLHVLMLLWLFLEIRTAGTMGAYESI